jgi:hypothetical protein
MEIYLGVDSEEEADLNVGHSSAPLAPRLEIIRADDQILAIPGRRATAKQIGGGNRSGSSWVTRTDFPHELLLCTGGTGLRRSTGAPGKTRFGRSTPKTSGQIGDPLALHREVKQLAAEGHAHQALENALEAFLLAIRTAGADDDTEEIINGVWDRLTGWCHASRRIKARSKMENGLVADSQVNNQRTVDPKAYGKWQDGIRRFGLPHYCTMSHRHYS